MPEEWKIFIKPDLNGSYPDVILLNPESGFVVLQVENWPLKDYRSNDPRDVLILGERDKIITRINHYRNKIIRLIPELGEKLIDNGKYLNIIGRVVYFHNLMSEEASLIKEKIYDKDGYISVCVNGELVETNINEIIRSLKYPNSPYMERKWGNQLEFWLHPPQHPKQGREIRLNSRQEDHAEPLEGHHRLKGPSGSGKTVIIAYRAARLASLGYRVLILTRNQALWHEIWSMVEGTPFKFEWGNLNFNHFHGFCYDFLSETGVRIPHFYDPDKKDQIMVSKMEEILETLDDDEVKKFKYDAIMIDEGQDFKKDWYFLISKFLTSRNELLFICDEKQNVFDNDTSWIHKMQGTQFPKKWRTLNSMYRFPEKIGNFVNEFACNFELDKEVTVEEGLQKKLIGRQPSPYIRWDNIDFLEWTQRILDSYYYVKSQGTPSKPIPDSDIVILLPNNETGEETVEMFRENHIGVDHILKEVNGKNNYNKRTFNYQDSRVTISTIHSYKGRECDHVIMMVPEELHGEKELDKLVYTGMTRAMEGLVVLNCNQRYWKFGKLDEEEEEDFSFDEEEFEAEIRPWLETLPYPLAYILWASFAMSEYKDRVDYLIKFFEFFSLFKLNILFSGALNGVPVSDYYLETKILRELRFFDTQKFLKEPGFGTWNYLNRSLSIYVSKNLQNNELIRRFGKVDRLFLEKLSNLRLNDLLDDLKTKRNLWKGHDTADIAIPSEEYEKRFNILQRRLLQLKELLGDIFLKTYMVSPIDSDYTGDGIHHYTVLNMMGPNSMFRQKNLETHEPLEKNGLYFTTRNKKQVFKLMPLILYEKNENIFYYYSGPYFESVEDDNHVLTDKLRFLPLNKGDKSEKSIPINKIYPVIAFFEEAQKFQSDVNGI